ncbi:nicotinate-nucleotide--dimethylbenzimidazole phosphoribosyltransferase [Caldimonas brevitalea]|uniref:Nicotinate-nucleotide--dimethylbenzimidazole phosphoribosyltransferase n=1 Tax=Caldimonas brevitalea TaxID=413882 RepID=A0A0G3BKE6_9BURK|nr:nicotinate-nucleotide--dimethylbenzimidazole phosphoribosyltransferase [Caldimonas brevitalea]AKJ29934.1 nicotinate-nucleotide--dimethylbenzimidazole phosphoribosyltransferase [Caldimonas brevitalea]
MTDHFASSRFVLPAIAAVADDALAARLQHLLDCKTKPLGSLGRLERLAVQIGLIQGRAAPQLVQPQLLVFAGDHGLAEQGVSAYPSDVTWQMVENFLAGGAAVSVLARQHDLALTVVDAGVRHTFEPRPGLQLRKIAAGTQDASSGPAMSVAQCEAALAAGGETVRERPGNAVLLGEMGIGNTSSASLLMARLCGLPIEDCVGRGTGLDDAGLAHKQAVLRRALQTNQAARAPLEVLAAFGGFEIAMMVGAALQAAHERRLIVVDGFITSAAMLVASVLAPSVLDYCVFAHRSGERGHGLLLQHLRAEPLLDLQMRLGEGSGGALAWPLIVSSLRLLDEMASFESAGVSERTAVV